MWKNLKSFITRKILHFELRIFFFDSYVYYWTRGFIVSTRAFDLSTCALNLLTRRIGIKRRIRTCNSFYSPLGILCNWLRLISIFSVFIQNVLCLGWLSITLGQIINMRLPATLSYQKSFPCVFLCTKQFTFVKNLLKTRPMLVSCCPSKYQVISADFLPV